MGLWFVVRRLEAWTCLEFPQTAHVITALKTRWHHALVQTGLDAGQTRGACSDHGDSVHHGDAARGREPTEEWKEIKGKHIFTENVHLE